MAKMNKNLNKIGGTALTALTLQAAAIYAPAVMAHAETEGNYVADDNVTNNASGTISGGAFAQPIINNDGTIGEGVNGTQDTITVENCELTNDNLNAENIIIGNNVTVSSDLEINSKNITITGSLTVSNGAALYVGTAKVIIGTGATLDGNGSVTSKDPFSIENHGTIAGNTYKIEETTSNGGSMLITISNVDGVIAGGTFADRCSINNTGTISGGTFDYGCGVHNGINDSGEVTGGIITGGTFNTLIDNNGGQISETVKAAVLEMTYNTEGSSSLKSFSLYNINIDENFLNGNIYNGIKQNEEYGGAFKEISLNGNVTISTDYNTASFINTESLPVTVNGKLTVAEGVTFTSSGKITVFENASLDGKGNVTATGYDNSGTINENIIFNGGEFENTAKGTINNGEFFVDVVNRGTINNGIFHKRVTNYGSISANHKHYGEEKAASGKKICNLCGQEYSDEPTPSNPPSTNTPTTSGTSNASTSSTPANTTTPPTASPTVNGKEYSWTAADPATNGEKQIKFPLNAGSDNPAINLGASESGKLASMMKLDGNGKPVFVSSSKVDTDGSVSLRANGAGNYIIVVSGETELKGDADNDGVLTAKDAVFILKKVAYNIVITTPKLDMNDDGFVNALDAALVLKKIASL